MKAVEYEAENIRKSLKGHSNAHQHMVNKLQSMLAQKQKLEEWINAYDLDL